MDGKFHSEAGNLARISRYFGDQVAAGRLSIHSFPQVLAVSTKWLSTRGEEKGLQRLCETGENIGSPSFPPSLSHRVPPLFCRNNERAGGAKSGALLDPPRRWFQGSSNRESGVEGESLELRNDEEEQEEARRRRKL